VRQPLYLGSTFLITGAVVASELIWFLPAAVAWALLTFEWASRREERRLAIRFGASFERYRAAVPKWIPRLSIGRAAIGPLAAPLRGAFVGQLPLLLVLVPFILKELNPFGFWPHH
jgi:hypothetical protein